MKGFTISGPSGPIFSMCHRHGELVSKVAALYKVGLPASDKCAVCGYRKVEKTKLLTFFHEVAKALSMEHAKLIDSGRHSETFVINRCQDALQEVFGELNLAPSALELIDDFVWCEAHARL